MKNSLFCLMMLLVTLSLSGQSKSDDPLEYIKKTFPQIYEVIVNEAGLKYPNDYPNKKHEIKMQCVSFGAFIIIMADGDSSIPKNDLFEICYQVVEGNSKNFKDYITPCENAHDNLEEFDCMFSKMIVNWVMALNELTSRIGNYKNWKS